MKINDRIITPNGIGIIKEIEEYSRLCKKLNKRYGVELENNPFNYSPAFYFKKDCKHIYTTKNASRSKIN